MGTIRELLGRLGLGVEPHIVDSVVRAAHGAARRAERSRRPRVAVRGRDDRAARQRGSASHHPARQLSGDRARRDRRGCAFGGGGAAAVGGGSQRATASSRTVAGSVARSGRPGDGPCCTRAPAAGSRSISRSSPAADPWRATPRSCLASEGAPCSRSRGRFRPSLALTGEFLVPFHARIPGVTMTTTIVSLRAVPAIEVLHAAWLSVDVGAGAGLDVIAIDAFPSPETPASSDVPVSIPPASSRVDPILTALVTAYAAITPGIAFTLAVGARPRPRFTRVRRRRTGGQRHPGSLAGEAHRACGPHVHRRRQSAVRGEDAVRRPAVILHAATATVLVAIVIACGSKTVTVATFDCEVPEGGNSARTCPAGRYCLTSGCGAKVGLCEPIEQDECETCGPECGCNGDLLLQRLPSPDGRRWPLCAGTVRSGNGEDLQGPIGVWRRQRLLRADLQRRPSSKLFPALGAGLPQPDGGFPQLDGGFPRLDGGELQLLDRGFADEVRMLIATCHHDSEPVPRFCWLLPETPPAASTPGVTGCDQLSTFPPACIGEFSAIHSGGIYFACTATDAAAE